MVTDKELVQKLYNETNDSMGIAEIMAHWETIKPKEQKVKKVKKEALKDD